METNLRLLTAINGTGILLISILAVVIVVLLIAVIVFIVKNKRKNKIPKIKIDDEFINTLYLGLGGKDNIKNITLDNGRLKFELFNTRLIDKNSLTKVSQSGIFITGTFVKLLFKYEAKDIKDFLENN